MQASHNSAASEVLLYHQVILFLSACHERLRGSHSARLCIKASMYHAKFRRHIWREHFDGGTGGSTDGYLISLKPYNWNIFDKWANLCKFNGEAIMAANNYSHLTYLNKINIARRKAHVLIMPAHEKWLATIYAFKISLAVCVSEGERAWYEWTAACDWLLLECECHKLAIMYRYDATWLSPYHASRGPAPSLKWMKYKIMALKYNAEISLPRALPDTIIKSNENASAARHQTREIVYDNPTVDMRPNKTSYTIFRNHVSWYSPSDEAMRNITLLLLSPKL